MKPTLQLRLGQSLAMTPQLQQAIRLLQLSTLELQQEIQQALDANPLLEQEESEGLESLSDQERAEAPTEESHEATDDSQLNTSEALNQENMPDERRWTPLGMSSIPPEPIRLVGCPVAMMNPSTRVKRPRHCKTTCSGRCSSRGSAS